MSAHKKLTRPLLHLAALSPLLWLIAEFLLNGPGPNPIQTLEKRSGDFALLLLLASLACTPLRTLTGRAVFTQFRRPLGLYAFGYAAAHLLLFVGLDYGFAWAEILKLVVEKTYLWFGLGAFLILLLLAITSTQNWQKRLKLNWRRLHALVFPGAVLAVLHFSLSVKGNIFLLRGEILWPLIALGALILLLLLRLKPVRAVIARWRR